MQKCQKSLTKSGYKKVNGFLDTTDPEIYRLAYMDRRVFFGAAVVELRYFRIAKEQVKQSVQVGEVSLHLWSQFARLPISTY